MSVRDELKALKESVTGIIRERDEARGRAAAAEAQARLFARAADSEKAEAHAWRKRCKELAGVLSRAIDNLDTEGLDECATELRAILDEGPRP